MTNDKLQLHQALLYHLEDTLDIVQGVMRAHPEYASLAPLEAILKGTIRTHTEMPKAYPNAYPKGLEVTNDD